MVRNCFQLVPRPGLFDVVLAVIDHISFGIIAFFCGSEVAPYGNIVSK